MIDRERVMKWLRNFDDPFHNQYNRSMAAEAKRLVKGLEEELAEARQEIEDLREEVREANLSHAERATPPAHRSGS